MADDAGGEVSAARPQPQRGRARSPAGGRTRPGSIRIGCNYRLPFTNYRSGFTLIEIVLVAVVLAILLANLVPNFRRSADRIKTEQIAFEMAQRLRLSHQIAVAESTSGVAFQWNPDERRITIERIGEQGGFQSGEDELVVKPLLVPPGIEIIIFTDEEDFAESLLFYPNGTSEAATIEIGRDGTTQLTITVDGATSQVILTKGSPDE